MAANFKMASDFVSEAMLSGMVKAWYTECRYENDKWRMTLGATPTIEHEPADGDRGEFLGAYSVVHLSSGMVGVEYMPLEELLKAKEQSKRNGPGSPWSTWFTEMCRKAVLKRHAKRFLPSTAHFDKFRRMLDKDNEEYRDVTPDQTPNRAQKYIGGDQRVSLWKKCLEQFDGDSEAAKAGLQKLYEENQVSSGTQITPEQFGAMMRALSA